MLIHLPRGTPVVDGPFVSRVVGNVGRGGQWVVCVHVAFPECDSLAGYRTYHRSRVWLARGGIGIVIRDPPFEESDIERVIASWYPSHLRGGPFGSG